jgi:hypothetical protein
MVYDDRLGLTADPKRSDISIRVFDLFGKFGAFNHPLSANLVLRQARARVIDSLLNFFDKVLKGCMAYCFSRH